MASPALALRFRDSTPGVDTIAEHRDIIARNGSVWWGWWKKWVEPIEPNDVLRRLGEGSFDLILIDRSDERVFRARCLEFTPNRGEIEPTLVPGYYREHLDEIAGFFRLGAIADDQYDSILGELIGQNTLHWLDGDEVAQPKSVAVYTQGSIGSCILHLSDMHFGADYGFAVQGERQPIGGERQTLTECIVADLARINKQADVAAIVVTGDFVTEGQWDDRSRRSALNEFEALRTRLNLPEDRILAVPGNHDIVRYPQGEVTVADLAVEGQANQKHDREFRTFVEELAGRGWRKSLDYVIKLQLSEVDVLFCILNSCTITATDWTEYGYVGTSGLDAIGALASETIDRPTYRFLALHHHLLPVADVEALNKKGVTLALDAAKILAAAQAAGVHVALHGHQHKPKVAIYQSLGLAGDTTHAAVHVVSNGSTGARDGRRPPGERNTYCLFQVAPSGLRLWMRELRPDGACGTELFNGSLDVVASQP